MPKKMSNRLSSKKNQQVPITVPLRSRKIRFSSSSPQPDSITKVEPQLHGSEHSASESDEAPETVSLKTAASRIKNKNTQSSLATKQLAKSQKENRRKRDQQFKEQAQKSRKRKTDALQDSRYLPDAILSAVAAAQELSPSDDDEDYQQVESTPKRQRNETSKLHKGPEDLTLGSLSVSVLQTNNMLLPPRSGLESKSLRNQWLRGRLANGLTYKEGKNQTIKMHRRTWKPTLKGFSDM